MSKKKSLPSYYKQLWSLAFYFANHNSCITGQLANYIKENFLTETYPYTDENGITRELPVFIDETSPYKPRSVYYDSRAKEIFINRHKAFLRQKAREFEEKSEFIPLRLFTRILSQRPTETEKKLKSFILNNCLNDTIEISTPSGLKEEAFIFNVPQNFTYNSPILVRRVGIRAFIEKHTDDLNQIGIDLSNALLTKYRPHSDLLYQTEVASAFYLNDTRGNTKFKLYQLMGTKGVFVQMTSPQGVYPLVQELKHNGKKGFCLKKSDLTYFAHLFLDELLALGVTPAALRCHTEGENVVEMTDKMIYLSSFLRHYLKTTTATRITDIICQKHLRDTYIDVDKNGQITQKPIFAKIGVSLNEKINYVFASRKAMYAFVKNNIDLIKNNGVSLVKLNNFLNEENQDIPQGESIPISDLAEKYHLIPFDAIKKIPEFSDETFNSFDANGHITVKPYLFLKRQQSKGNLLKYHILKEGIYSFLSRHQQELKISDSILTALKNDKPVSLKTDDMLSVIEVASFLGRENQFSFVKRFLSYLEENHLKDTYQDPQTGETKEVLSYALGKNGTVALFFNAKGLALFLSNNTFNLVKIGLKLTDIHSALKTIRTTPDFYLMLGEKRKLANQQKALRRQARKGASHER